MISGINRVGIPSINRMRASNFNSVSNYERRNIAQANARNFASSSFKERMNFLDNMFGLNAVKVTRNGNNKKDSNGIEVLSVNMDSEKKLKDKVLNIKVNDLAKPQKNASVNLFYKKQDIETGSYEFKISSNGKDFKGKIDVKNGDANEVVLDKLALNINSLNSGVKAEVAKNKNGGTVLNLVSSETGTKSAFKIADLQGNVVSKLKLNNINQQCGDAVYSVNGRVLKSSTNEISIADNAVKLKLKSVGDFNIDINKKRCYEAIQGNSDNISSHLDYLVSHYNKKIGVLPKETFTYKKLTNELRDRKSRFNNVGIDTLKDNTMNFKNKSLKELAKSNPELLVSSMTSQKGVLNFFNMVKSSDLDRGSSLYGGRGNNIGVFRRGTLLDYV